VLSVRMGCRGHAARDSAESWQNRTRPKPMSLPETLATFFPLSHAASHLSLFLFARDVADTFLQWLPSREISRAVCARRGACWEQVTGLPPSCSRRAARINVSLRRDFFCAPRINAIAATCFGGAGLYGGFLWICA
jgi:hypothetical protein